MKSHTFSIQNSHQIALLMVSSSSYSLHFPEEIRAFFVGTQVTAGWNQSIFRRNTSHGRLESEHFFAGTQEKPEQTIELFSCSGLLFHFSDFVNRRRAQRKALLHCTRRGKNTDALLKGSDCLPVLVPLMPVKAADHLHILFAQFKIEFTAGCPAPSQ